MLSSAAAKKKPADFSQFKGSYVGLPVTIVFMGTPYSAIANIVASVPKSGTSAVITVTGNIVAGGNLFPVSSTFTLTKNAIAISEAAYGVEKGLPASGAGHLNRKGTAFTYSAPIAQAPSIVCTGVVSVKPQGKKKKVLTVSLQFVASNAAYSFPFSGVAKVKK